MTVRIPVVPYEEKPNTLGFLKGFVQDKVWPKLKEVWNRPIMAPTITKDQHLEQIRSHGGDPSHWEDNGNYKHQLIMPSPTPPPMYERVIEPSNYGW